MSVSNYTPSIDNGCAYAHERLKNVVYFVSEAHLKDVHIDNGQAYIDGLTEAPTRLDCFSIQFEENETLDERYKFTKSLRFSVNGYMNMSYFTGDGLFYAFIETEDGTPYMINVDFPSRITYTYNLSANVDQTDFTFSSQSNFPSLMVATQMGRDNVCNPYRTNGIESLKLIERDYTAIAKNNDTITVYTYQGKDFSIIDYMKDTCTLSESYDGERVTDTITFDIGFNNYKTSWHYNLLEFLDNLYAAIITPKSHTNQFFIGFDLGLQPSYNIQANDSDGQTDKITVTLVDSTNRGLVALNDYEEEHHTVTTWRYVKWVGSIKAYECTENGTARYLLQQEVDGLGNPTGRYKAYTGWTQYFIARGLNVIEEFSESVEFDSPECSLERCTLNTNIPSRITFTSVTCNTYNLLSSCDWNISGLPSYITATPSTGQADTQYTVSICNTRTPTSTAVEDDFIITYGDGTRVVNTTVKTDAGILRPSVADVTCPEQNVTFTFNPDCPITVTSIPSELSYEIGASTLVVTVPRNYTTSARSFNITVRDCNGETQTVTINQDKTYERWVNSTGYICVGNDSYTRQLRYTGTTASNINTPTGEYRAGTLIQEGDSRCSSYITRWSFLNHYYCINGEKTKVLEEEISYDGGTTWTKTGVTKLGDVVEDTDHFCDQEATYSWLLSTKWQCGT